MPGWGEGPSTSIDDLDESYATAPLSEDLRLQEEIGHQPVLQQATKGVLWLQSQGEQLFGQPDDFGTDHTLSSEEANERYGVDGYLRFNQPVSEFDAAFQANAAHEKRFRDEVLSRSEPNGPLDQLAGLGGTLTDPGNIGLAIATGGLGEGVLGALGLGARVAEAGEVGAAVTGLGRVWNLAAGVPRALAVGGIENAPFVGANAFVAGQRGDDYGFGDALRDLAAGSVLHAGIHTTLKLAGALADPYLSGERAPRTPEEAAAQLAALRGETALGAAPGGPGMDFNAEPRLSRAELMTSTARVVAPPEVEALTPAARTGAFVKAVDDAINDRPVDVGELVARAAAPPSLDRLSETDALTELPSWRPLPEDGRGEPGKSADVAVTTRGTEVPVRFGLAELGDLVTSHTDDMQINPAYPPELQPRERGRAGAQARNLQLEKELNPKLLLNDTGAGSGAPIVSPAGVVESGNGRTIALRRSAVTGSPAYGRYLAELKAQGYDVGGMRQPVLVRMRTEPLTGIQRASLAHEMNADVTERMSAPEQAMADAGKLDDATMAQLDADDPAARRNFARAFLARVAPDQIGDLTTPEGRLSAAGERRIGAALVAKAYGDPRLVEALIENEAVIKAIGGALRDAAPAWAAMRAAMARGEVAPALDLTEALTSAVDLVRAAREGRQGVGAFLAERLGQTDLFAGDVVSPETEAFLRLFYRDEGFARPTAGERVAEALKDYARRASAFESGPDLLGETADADTARSILRQLADRFARGDDGDAQQVRAPGRTEGAGGAGGAAEPLVLDLRRPGGERGAGGEGVPREGEPAARGEGERGAGDGAELGDRGNEPGNAAGRQGRGPTGAQLVSADPELRELAEDTDRVAALHGLEIPEDPKQSPDTVAEAVRAAAVCLAEEA